MLTPELILAEHGIAALCVNNNDSNYFRKDAKGDVVPLNLYRAQWDAYVAGVDDLHRRGVVDTTKIGVSGHSFTSDAIAYGISHSTLAAAAVIGTGILIDPASYFITAPTADSWRRGFLVPRGLPNPNNDPDRIWNKISPALNADKIQTALLLQPAESEYLTSLQLVSRMQDSGKASDMFVYPGAGHLFGRYPRQQFSRAERSIDWFRFWLQHEEPANADKSEQFRRWEALRRLRRIAGVKPEFGRAAQFQDRAQASASTNDSKRK